MPRQKRIAPRQPKKKADAEDPIKTLMEDAVIMGLQTALPRSPGLRRALEHVQSVMDKMNGQQADYMPQCYHCDRQTRRDPCEHCGISNPPVGTREQAAAANARRQAIQLTKQPDGSYK